MKQNDGSTPTVVKQGAYGKVAVHKKEWLLWPFRPLELIAMIRCKLTGLFGGWSRSLSSGLEGYELDEEDVKFCSTKLKQVSRSFATVITFLPNNPHAPLRLGIAMFYLVLRALDTVEDEMDLNRFNHLVTDEDKRGVEDARLAVKQRLLRTFAQRLQEMMDGECVQQSLTGLGEGDEKELLENLESLTRVMRRLPVKIQEVILSITQEMGDGMAEYIARDLHNGTEDEEDFEHYCHVAAGTVGDGLTRLFAACGYAPQELVLRRDLWDSMGSFLQRTNIIRDYLEDLVDGRAWWPRSVWELYVVSPNGQPQQHKSLSMLAGVSMLSSGRSLQCLDHMIADALELVPQCLDYLGFLEDPRVLSFCALPQVMAIATLAELFDNPHLFSGVVKIRKGQAARIMLSHSPGNFAGDKRLYLSWFLKYFREIQVKNQNRSDYLLRPNERVEEICQKAILAIEHKQLCDKKTSSATDWLFKFYPASLNGGGQTIKWLS